MIANPLTGSLRTGITALTEKTMNRTIAIVTSVAALTCASAAPLSAQNSAPGDWQQFLSTDGVTVYDSVNYVVWLADANLAGQTLSDGEDFRFGLPVCPPLTMEPTEACVNPSGS